MKKLSKKRQNKFSPYKKIFIFFAIWAFLILSTFVGFSKPNDPEVRTQPTPTPAYEDFHLIIPALNVNAPIIADVDGTNKVVYDKALEGGVAQLKGSSKPGEGSNIFIFGHSSYYFWAAGDYKNVFKNLDDLKENDEIIIWYNLKEYKYKVIQTKVVWPNEVDVALPTKKEQVSLMTCVPPGTTLKRLIVVAVPI